MLNYLWMTIRVLLCPKCWILPWKVNKHWDNRLRYYLDHYCDMKYYINDPEAKYAIIINGKMVIISDFPKNYGTRVNGATIGHPSRKTMMLLKDMVEDFKFYG